MTVKIQLPYCLLTNSEIIAVMNDYLWRKNCFLDFTNALSLDKKADNDKGL